MASHINVSIAVKGGNDSPEGRRRLSSARTNSLVFIFPSLYIADLQFSSQVPLEHSYRVFWGCMAVTGYYTDDTLPASALSAIARPAHWFRLWGCGCRICKPGGGSFLVPISVAAPISRIYGVPGQYLFLNKANASQYDITLRPTPAIDPPAESLVLHTL